MFLRARRGAGNSAFVGQLCKLRADFIGAARTGLLSPKRPVEKPASRMQSCPTMVEGAHVRTLCITTRGALVEEAHQQAAAATRAGDAHADAVICAGNAARRERCSGGYRNKLPAV
jgi:hypothetical protein